MGSIARLDAGCSLVQVLCLPVVGLRCDLDLWSCLLVPSGFVAHHLLLWNLSPPKPSANVTELCSHFLKQ